jgi:hypothetical protein
MTLGALIALTIVLIVQNTKHAMLPRAQASVLWGAELASLAAVLVLRSGLMRDDRWREEQERLGTIVNDFYEPRRAYLVQGFAIGGGVFGGLWWGIATWSVVFAGMRRATPTRGLDSFEVATLCGMLTGALLGAVLGLCVGYVWEQSHRRGRRQRSKAHA